MANPKPREEEIMDEPSELAEDNSMSAIQEMQKRIQDAEEKAARFQERAEKAEQEANQASLRQMAMNEAGEVPTRPRGDETVPAGVYLVEGRRVNAQGKPL